jgi:hypothetical protein
LAKKEPERQYGPEPRFDEARSTKRISVVVTEAQLKDAKELAKKSGKTLSTWALEVLLKAIERGK